MNRRDKKEPGDPRKICPDEFLMSVEGGAESFVVKDQRNLHRSERQDKTTHNEAFHRKIVEHVGHIPEIGEQ